MLPNQHRLQHKKRKRAKIPSLDKNNLKKKPLLAHTHWLVFVSTGSTFIINTYNWLRLMQWWANIRVLGTIPAHHRLQYLWAWPSWGPSWHRAGWHRGGSPFAPGTPAVMGDQGLSVWECKGRCRPEGGAQAAVTFPKDPCPNTLSSSNWEASAFSEPSLTTWVMLISLMSPSSWRGQNREDQPGEYSQNKNG